MGMISVVVDPMSTKRQSPKSLATRADEADQLAATSSIGSCQSNPLTPKIYWTAESFLHGGLEGNDSFCLTPVAIGQLAGNHYAHLPGSFLQSM